MPSQLADGGGFASAIDTGDHHNSGTMLRNIEFALQRLEQFTQHLDQQALDLGHVFAASLFDFELELFKDVLRGGNTRISHQQGGFKFGVSLLVQQFACEHRGNAVAGALQTAAQSTQPVAAGHFGCLAGHSAYAWRGFSFE